jgi:hypothetical protein
MLWAFASVIARSSFLHDRRTLWLAATLLRAKHAAAIRLRRNREV